MELILPDVFFDPFAESVLASGSIVEGFHNLYSDLDILIIGDRPQPSKALHSFYVAGMNRWVDLAWLSEFEVDTLISRLNAEEPREWYGPPALSLKDYDLAHRLKIAIPLTNHAAVRDQKRREILAGPLLCRSFCHSNVRAARARWYDAVGAFQSNQFQQALHVMRICHSLSTDGMLALFGETNPNEKWKLAKIARASNAMRNGGISFSPSSDHKNFELFMRETAALLFGVTALYHGQAANDLPPPDLATSRYEYTSTGLYIVHANGHRDPI